MRVEYSVPRLGEAEETAKVRDDSVVYSTSEPLLFSGRRRGEHVVTLYRLPGAAPPRCIQAGILMSVPRHSED